MAQLYKTDIDEQETIINFDYGANQVFVYTCNNTVYKSLVKKLGQPCKTYYIKQKINGATWVIPFSERSTITQILSRPTLVGNIA